MAIRAVCSAVVSRKLQDLQASCLVLVNPKVQDYSRQAAALEVFSVDPLHRQTVCLVIVRSMVQDYLRPAALEVLLVDLVAMPLPRAAHTLKASLLLPASPLEAFSVPQRAAQIFPKVDLVELLAVRSVRVNLKLQDYSDPAAAALEVVSVVSVAAISSRWAALLLEAFSLLAVNLLVAC
jgi:hypothetical protein